MTASKPGPAPGDRTAIGITFGNSNSSIAVTVDDKAEVIANEDGGELLRDEGYSGTGPLWKNHNRVCMTNRHAW